MGESPSPQRRQDKERTKTDVMNLVNRPDSGCGGIEVGDWYGDYVGVCGVRRSEECEGPECFVGSLCGSFWIPATNLVDRHDSRCGEFQGVVGYGDNVGLYGVSGSEECQGPGSLVGNYNNKLCSLFLVPVMNLVNRPDSGYGGFEVVDWYGIYVCVCGVRREK